MPVDAKPARRSAPLSSSYLLLRFSEHHKPLLLVVLLERARGSAFNKLGKHEEATCNELLDGLMGNRFPCPVEVMPKVASWHIADVQGCYILGPVTAA